MRGDRAKHGSVFVMRAPSFWWKPPGLISALLTPLASIYGAAAQARLKKQGQKAEIPVICVGNLVAGGAGKTPTALFVAQWLLKNPLARASSQEFLIDGSWANPRVTRIDKRP